MMQYIVNHVHHQPEDVLNFCHNPHAGRRLGEYSDFVSRHTHTHERYRPHRRGRDLPRLGGANPVSPKWNKSD